MFEAYKMVTITFKSWEEIVVHEVTRHESLRKFLEQKVVGIPKGIPIDPLLWTDGLLFVRVPMPPTSDVIKEQLRGIIHFQAVEYVPMNKYKKSITQNDVTIPIVDVSNMESFKDLVKAIKKREGKLA
jgi:hypothetical protein